MLQQQQICTVNILICNERLHGELILKKRSFIQSSYNI